MLARDLHAVLDRKVVIGWARLLDRPDALDARETSNSAVAGQPRRSILLGALDLGERVVPIRLARVKPSGGDPAWVFSRRTVDDAPALHAAYGPSRLERALPGPLRRTAFGGLMWWEVIGLPLMAAAAVAAGLAVFRVTRWATLRAVGTWTGIVLGSLRWPATIAAVTAVLALATRAFTFSGPIDAVIAPLVVLGFATAVVVFAMQALDAALERIVTFEAAELSFPGEAERRTWATTVSAIRRVIPLLVVLVGAGIALSSAGVFQTFGFSLLASAGALTLGGGLRGPDRARQHPRLAADHAQPVGQDRRPDHL